MPPRPHAWKEGAARGSGAQLLKELNAPARRSGCFVPRAAELGGRCGHCLATLCPCSTQTEIPVRYFQALCRRAPLMAQMCSANFGNMTAASARKTSKHLPKATRVENSQHGAKMRSNDSPAKQRTKQTDITKCAHPAGNDLSHAD